MKKLSLFIVLIMAFASCDTDLADVHFSIEISATSDPITVNESKGGANAFLAEFEIDLANIDTDKYLDYIEEIDLEDVSLVFNGLEDLAGNQEITTLIITIDNDIVFTFENFTYDQIANGSPLNIEDAQKLDQLAELLKTKIKIPIRIEGEIPDFDYHQFTVTFKAIANITASAL